jgi:hypothetical protein
LAVDRLTFRNHLNTPSGSRLEFKRGRVGATRLRALRVWVYAIPGSLKLGSGYFFVSACRSQRNFVLRADKLIE